MTKLSTMRPALRQRLERQLAAEDAATARAKNYATCPNFNEQFQNMIAKEPAAGKRIRQESKALLNKLETEWLAQLRRMMPAVTVRSQAWRVKLGNGIWFKVDFCAVVGGQWTAWEVKGPHAFRGGMENLKVAACCYPEIRWLLVWKVKGEWKQQVVLP